MFTEDRKEAKMKRMFFLVASVLAGLTLLTAACGGDDEQEPTPSPEATAAPPAAPTPTEAGGVEISDIVVDAASATITVDGDDSDWASIEGATIPLKQTDVDELDPVQVQDLEIDI